MSLLAPISVGDLADRITILRIKSQRIADLAKLSYISHELRVLSAVWDGIEFPVKVHGDILVRMGELQNLNEALWSLEDEARALRLSDPPERFVDCLRAITRTNDARAREKLAINALSGSSLREVKSH